MMRYDGVILLEVIIQTSTSLIILNRQTATLVLQSSSRSNHSLALIVKLRQRDSVTIRRSGQLSYLTSFDRSADLSLILF